MFLIMGLYAIFLPSNDMTNENTSHGCILQSVCMNVPWFATFCVEWRELYENAEPTPSLRNWILVGWFLKHTHRVGMNNMNEEANVEWLLVLQILSGSLLLYDTDD